MLRHPQLAHFRAGMNHALQIQSRLLEELYTWLYPGDAKESVAVGSCSHEQTCEQNIFVVRQVVPVTTDGYISRQENIALWSTADVADFITMTAGRDQTPIAFHSHPSGQTVFSREDDVADLTFHGELARRYLRRQFFASAIMLPDRTLIARVVDPVQTFYQAEIRIDE